jgi:BMFP domain-containing protein YqiC
VQTRNQIVEDVSRVLSGLAGTVAGAGREVETRAREKLREAVGGLDLVGRDEFEAVRAMAANARAEVEALRAEVAALRAAAAGTGAATGGASGPADGSPLG